MGTIETLVAEGFFKSKKVCDEYIKKSWQLKKEGEQLLRVQEIPPEVLESEIKEIISGVLEFKKKVA
jgi:hypothetical protein